MTLVLVNMYTCENNKAPYNTSHDCVRQFDLLTQKVPLRQLVNWMIFSAPQLSHHGAKHPILYLPHINLKCPDLIRATEIWVSINLYYY